MSDLAKFRDFAALKISLASPETVRSWSHGEVREPETINYRTFRAEKDGLFCEKIFGPTKDFECYCGKYRKVRFKGVICDKCGVEVTRRRVRRERMGHIELVSPCAHVWFFGTIPSKMALLLGVNPRDLKAVIYYSRCLVIEVDEAKKKEVLGGLDQELEQEKAALATEVGKKIQEIEKTATKEAKGAKDDKAAAETSLTGRRETARLRDELVTNQANLEKSYAVLGKHLQEVYPLGIIGEGEYQRMKAHIDRFARVGMGALAVKKVLSGLDVDWLAKTLRKDYRETKSREVRRKILRRLRVASEFARSGVKPEWMVVDVLPVIPPELRPMVQLEGGRFATSDLNDLYRVVINRNNRLRDLLALGAPEIILRNERRMLQEAVDALIDSRRVTRRYRGQKELRSLSDLIKGKQGRFRRNLLGKRVDYSGRSVIVVGPELNLYECGLPREMALELFKPMVLREILLAGLAPNVRAAKDFLEERSGEVWDLLEKIVAHHPVLLNRAPTLHRLGIVAFYPKLTDSKAIQIHPCVCAGYNADFDGDQMAVHVPLSSGAVREAKELMLSSKNLLKPSSGTPIVSPTKDMILGLYWLTAVDPKLALSERPLTLPEAMFSWESGNLNLRQPARIEFDGTVQETTLGRVIFNQILPESLRFMNQTIGKKEVGSFLQTSLETEGTDRTVVLVDAMKSLGFRYATQSGTSISGFDTRSVPGKAKVLAEAEGKVATVERNFSLGLITDGERRRLSQEIWLDATNQLDTLAWESLAEDNPMRLMVESGARGSRDQVKQMAGMKGLVVDPTGRIADLPTKSNLFEGLLEFEYFVGTRGSRKGLTDTALKTADAGYLTRRLVDVAQEVLVREKDCGTRRGWEILRADPAGGVASLSERILGRVLARTVKDSSGQVLAERGELITKVSAQEIEKSDVAGVWVRSPLTCETHFGICQKCYGVDLGWGDLVAVGSPVGVIAAQSIGEPGTQLTLHGKQAGKGIVGAMEITRGLPRVEQIFEARTPKALSPISRLAGKVHLTEAEEGMIVKIVSADGEEIHEIPQVLETAVAEGDLISEGTQLASGYLDPEEVLEVSGLLAAERYLLSEVQKVYSSQGVALNDKHVEIILRQMFSRVRVVTSGDTTFLPGEIVSKDSLLIENERIEQAGGEKAKARQLVLGVTKVSLNTDSWLAASSFQETTRVLTDAATKGAVDYLRGLKENVIVGRKLPVVTDDSAAEAAA